MDSKQISSAEISTRTHSAVSVPQHTATDGGGMARREGVARAGRGQGGAWLGRRGQGGGVVQREGVVRVEAWSGRGVVRVGRGAHNSGTQLNILQPKLRTAHSSTWGHTLSRNV